MSAINSPRAIAAKRGLQDGTFCFFDSRKVERRFADPNVGRRFINGYFAKTPLSDDNRIIASLAMARVAR
jgi:hypothetical protein